MLRSLQGAKEAVDNAGIEVRAAHLVQLNDSLIMRARLAVNPIVGHGFVGVHHRQDACPDGDVLAVQALWVTGAVIFFLMGIDIWGDMGKLPEGLHHVGAHGGMELHHCPLVQGEGTVLAQDAVGNADFADIVEQTCPIYALDFVFLQSQDAGGVAYPLRHLGAVPGAHAHPRIDVAGKIDVKLDPDFFRVFVHLCPP